MTQTSNKNFQTNTQHMLPVEMRLITNRTTCQMSCEPAPLSNPLAHPAYTINNYNTRGKPEQLGQNILSPTASELTGV
jgi:hypothetical protein